MFEFFDILLILICTTFPPYSGLDFCSFDFPFWFCKIFLLCIFPFRLFLSYFHYFVNYCSFPKPLFACLRNLIVYIFNLAMFFSAMDSFVYMKSDLSKNSYNHQTSTIIIKCHAELYSTRISGPYGP